MMPTWGCAEVPPPAAASRPFPDLLTIPQSKSTCRRTIAEDRRRRYDTPRVTSGDTILTWTSRGTVVVH